MNEKLKNFLDAERAVERKKYEKERDEVLLSLGLCEREYADEYSEEFCLYEVDLQTGKTNWYKQRPIEISDEEYEELKKHIEIKKHTGSSNAVSIMLRVIAILVYVGGFVAGIVFGEEEFLEHILGLGQV